MRRGHKAQVLPSISKSFLQIGSNSVFSSTQSIDCMKTLLLLLISSHVAGKGIYLVEEFDGRTYAKPIPGTHRPTVVDQIMTILDLEDFDPTTVRKRKESENVGKFMQKLYEQMEIFEKRKERQQKHSEIWLSADRVSTQLPIEAIQDGAEIRLTFSKEDLLDRSQVELIASELRVQVNTEVDEFTVAVTPHFQDKQKISSRTHVATFNLTTTVEGWYEQEAEPQITLITNTETPITLDVFIVSAYKDTSLHNPKRRSRRATSSAVPLSSDAPKPKSVLQRENGISSCARHGMYVDFEALGWKEWVIAPQGFSAYFCSGACSFPLHSSMNATTHATIQTLVNLVRPDAAAAAKCVPSELSSLKIFFYDNKKNTQIKRYRDMIAEQCGCR